jgi:peptidase M1-like protein
MDSRVALLPALFWAACAVAQPAAATAIIPSGAAHAPNADKDYVALRGDLPASGGITVKDLTLKREGAVFHFDEGSFYFYPPVEGRYTGAVFEGKGTFTLAPEAKSEQKSLALLTKSPSMKQDFSSMVLRFTDDTSGEIRKSSNGEESPASGHAKGAAEDLQKAFRKALHQNLDLRVLSDVMSADHRGRFFLASFHMGNLVDGQNLLFIVDPEATFATADQVELATWDGESLQPWVGYGMNDLPAAERDERARVTDENLDVTLERSGMMRTSAITAVKVRRDGLRIVPLDLYPTLRVTGVFAENGTPLDFVQENKEQDPQFAAILPESAKAGDTVRVLVQYGGKDALRADGNDTYYLLSSARESWYPAGHGRLGDFANFHMVFHVPKGLTVVATGKQMSATPESGGTKAVWETQTPIAVAGFNLGGFKTLQGKTPQGFTVDAYADTQLPQAYESLENAGIGGFDATGAMKTEVAQGVAAIQIYSAYFGNLPYDHVALTEQTACNYGQSWPMLVYLPICGFWDETAQNAVGLRGLGVDSYWSSVTAHEVAHQWWGQLVGFNSYRDQWMSEGFAQFSAGLYKKNTSKKMDDYLAFWKEQQKLLIQKNEHGLRPIDVGPLTMGYRVANEKTGNIYQDLIYSKGAYVLHMLEMQFAWAKDGGEGAFKNSMQQFVKEYSGKAATTEDWKASMERTMPKSLDLDGNGKLDWFFNEWVYGTTLPHYAVNSQLIPSSDGTTTGYLKLAQSNVPDDFQMIVPLYIQFADGRTAHIGGLTMRGNTTFEQKIPLGKVPANAKNIVVNAYADILNDSTE